MEGLIVYLHSLAIAVLVGKVVLLSFAENSTGGCHETARHLHPRQSPDHEGAACREGRVRALVDSARGAGPADRPPRS
jgi:hypothetical protein